MKKHQRIILSRTDSIGDVVLTLPMAGVLKRHLPECTVIFLGSNYTREIVSLSSNVDEFLSWDDFAEADEPKRKQLFQDIQADAIIHVFPKKEIAKLAAKAGIAKRIGTTGRFYHYLYCNELVRFSRRKSGLHEAQLNFKLLKPLIGEVNPSLREIGNYYSFKVAGKLDNKWSSLIDKDRFNLILHPKSKGSAREWPLADYSRLIRALPEKSFKVFISGTSEEGKLLESFLQENKEELTDLTGKLSLSEFIRFIDLADGLVAASTGPLHIAAALGKLAIGIYPPIRPMHPGRWAPIGNNAHYAVVEKECNDCRTSLDCHCMAEVSADQVSKLIIENAGKRQA